MDVKQKLAEFRTRLAAVSDHVEEQNAAQKALRGGGATDATTKTTTPNASEKAAPDSTDVKKKGDSNDASKSEYDSAGKMSPSSY